MSLPNNNILRYQLTKVQEKDYFFSEPKETIIFKPYTDIPRANLEQMDSFIPNKAIVNIELAPKMNSIVVIKYSVITLLGTVGGLIGFLASLFQALIKVLQFRALHMYLASHLYGISHQ